MIHITIDKNEFVEFLEDHDQRKHKAFIQLNESEQKRIINDLVEEFHNSIDGDLLHIIEERL